MTQRNRAVSMAVLCLMVMLIPKPSASQEAKVDRKAWRKLERADSLARIRALANIDGDVDQALLEEIAKNDRDPAIRARATAQVRNQTLLASLAVKDPVVQVREEATSKLSDSQTLILIVKTDPSSTVRRNAAGNLNLTDQATLATVAISDRGDTYGSVRNKALARLTDQALIASVVRDSDYLGLRKAAVEKLTDQMLLEQIAQSESIVLEVRLQAVRKLLDQALVARLVATGDNDVRLAAVEALTDQTLLANIARSDSSVLMRKRAATKLTDQADLLAVASSDRDAGVRSAAVRRVSDEAALARIAKSDPDKDTALAAAMRVKDEAITAGIAAGAANAEVRHFAVLRIRDKSVLADIGRKDPSAWIRECAIRGLTDQSVLTEIGRADRDWEVRLSAVKKLEDQTTLGLIAKTDPHATVAELALSLLKQPSTGQLEEIIKAGASFGARMAALDKIDDRAVMEKYANGGADPWIRGLAALKLPNDPVSDIVIQLSNPTLAMAPDDSIAKGQMPISLWVADRNSPVAISGVMKFSTPTGDRLLTPGQLVANLSVQNRNPFVGYEAIRITCSFSIDRLSDGMSSTWSGDSIIPGAPPAATAEVACIVEDNGRQLAPPGMYRATSGRFIVREARTFVRVPRLAGTVFRSDLDPAVLSRTAAIRIESSAQEFNWMYLTSSMKR